MKPKPFNLDKSLLAVVLAAIAARVWYFAAYLGSPFANDYRADQQYYREWALRIAAGDWIGHDVFEQGPVYPYLLGMFYAFFGQQDNAVLVLQLLAGVFTCVLVFWCGKKLFGQPVGTLAGIIVALLGPLVYYESMLMKTFLSPLLTMIAMLAGLKYGDDQRIRWLIVAGLSIGLACLVRENHLLLLVALGVWVIYIGQRHAMPLRRQWGHRLVLFGSLLLAIVPSASRNYLVSGEVVLVTAGGGEVFYMAHGPEATGSYKSPSFAQGNPNQQHEDFRIEAERRTGRELNRGESSRYWFRQAASEVINNPGRTIWLTCVKAVGCLNDFEVPSNQYFAVARDHILPLRLMPTFGWIAGLGVIGIAVCFRDWARYQLPILFVAAHFLSVLLTYNLGRFRSGMIPVWALFAAYGGIWIVSNWRSSRGMVFGVTTCCAITVTAFLPPLNYSNTNFAYERDAYHLMLAMQRGDIEQAERHARDAAEHANDSRQAESHRVLGQLLQRQGRMDEAERHFRLSIESNPKETMSQVGLADIFAARQEWESAREHYSEALTSDPKNVPANFGMGKLYIAERAFQQAVDCFEVVVASQPQLAQAHFELGRAHEELEHDSRAIEHYVIAFQLRRGMAEAAMKAAWLLATSVHDNARNGQQAVSLALHANEAIGQPHPIVLDTLAAAYAETTDFESASRFAKLAFELASQSSDKSFANRIESRQELYEDRKAYRGPR